MSYVKCDKCGSEAKAEGLVNSVGWMTCVKLTKEQIDQMEMMDKLLGKGLSTKMIAESCTRSLCGVCSTLFEKFVEEHGKV